MVAPLPGGDNGVRSPRRPPRRRDIAAAEAEVIKAGRVYKADIYAVDLGHGPFVVKDFAAKSALVRLMGRFQIGHECRAYEWLGPMPGVPDYLGRIDAHALAVEKVDGIELVDDPRRFSHRRANLRSLRQVIDCFLAKGFFHLDVRARHNVMVREDGQVMLIDLAGSLWVPPGTRRYRLFEPFLRRFYLNILRKWRKLLTPGRSYRDEKAPVSKLMMWARMPHKLYKKLTGWK
jgi:hypothetical protein